MGAQWALQSTVWVTVALVSSSRLIVVGCLALLIVMRPRPCSIAKSPLIVQNGGGHGHSLAGAEKSYREADGQARVGHQAEHNIAELVLPRLGAHHHAICPEQLLERGNAESLEVLG